MSATLLATLAMGLHKPKEIPEVNVDVGEEYTKTAKENISLIPTLAELTAKANTVLQDEQIKAMERLVPGVGGLISKGVSGTAELLKGRLPADVLDYLNRKTAEYATSSLGGSRGGSFEGAKFGSDLRGLSMQAFGQGLSAAQSWINMAKSAPQVDFTSMLINPQFRTQLKFQQEMFNTQIRGYNTKLAAMPEPWQQEVLNSTRALDSIIANTAQSVLSSYTGGMMGGMFQQRGPGAAGGAGGGEGGGGSGGGGGSPGSIISRGYDYSMSDQETGLPSYGNRF